MRDKYRLIPAANREILDDLKTIDRKALTLRVAPVRLKPVVEKAPIPPPMSEGPPSKRPLQIFTWMPAAPIVSAGPIAVESKAWWRRFNAGQRAPDAATLQEDASIQEAISSFALSLETFRRRKAVHAVFGVASSSGVTIHPVVDRPNTFFVLLAALEEDVIGLPEKIHTMMSHYNPEKCIKEGGKIVIHPSGAYGDHRVYCEEVHFMLAGRPCRLLIGDRALHHTGKGKIPQEAFELSNYQVKVMEAPKMVSEESVSVPRV